MVNNAGIAQIKPLAEVTPEDLEKIMRINLGGVLWGIQAAAKKFQKRKQKGKIIRAASIAGHEGYPLLGVIARPSSQFAL
jgi:meso-butanediol dehydrogenase/(S,S)-butanediol dehydrogenase/diacetyl reductase